MMKRAPLVRSARGYIGFIRAKPFFVVGAVVVFVALYLFLLLAFKKTQVSPLAFSADSVAAVAVPEQEAVTHLLTPEPLKAIYMTACVAGTSSFRNELVTFIEETELNALVIDIKDYSGYLSFEPKAEDLTPFLSPRCRASDMEEFIETLHEKGIYVIGRITVFQDPVLTKRRPELAVKKRSDGSAWHDYKRLSFSDPGAKEVWDHHVAIAKESYAIGFDELNFDYIRFPSDGPMQDIAFFLATGNPRAAVPKYNR
ncbi:MAG: hypothetical protein Greene041679_110 [Parcubacteria group bacterium Greene0416_79]|nr:MAG: hypothetical protein Greene041679_110 [Parcubacteria group bacterium Greene0416_79]